MTGAWKEPVLWVGGIYSLLWFMNEVRKAIEWLEAIHKQASGMREDLLDISSYSKEMCNSLHAIETDMLAMKNSR